jgi:hypothetical protein
VNAVRRVGERPVSGEAVPDEWIVRGDGLECLHNPEDAVDARGVASVADLGRRVEKILGGPQDVKDAGVNVREDGKVRPREARLGGGR